MESALIWLAAIAALILGIYLIARMRRPGLETFRAEAPGQFADLPGGTTHYQWHGQRDGPVLVCVHGLSTPSFVWGPLLPHLERMGFSILTYDLYGRGYSDRTGGRQNADFFLRQLDELLDHQGVTDKFNLMGYSMGGAIATAFAARSPERLSQLVLIAPGGLGHDLGAFSRLVVNTPVIGDWLNEVFGGTMFKRTNLQVTYDDPEAQAILEGMCNEVDRAGTLSAMLSSQRGILRYPLFDDHEDILVSGPPVLAIWGATDTVIPISCMGRLAQHNRNAVQIEIANADHGLTYTHPAEVAEAIAENI